MKRLLEKKHYRVSVFVDASEALAAFCRDPAQFDLVISDYNMPGMSGLDFARAVKARSKQTPVAITSGHIHDSLRASAPAAGVSELIYKPDTVEELFAAVDRLASAVVGKTPD
jgi:CheY-like chemotaxis protein